jgi:hypothetical protein
MKTSSKLLCELIFKSYLLLLNYTNYDNNYFAAKYNLNISSHNNLEDVFINNYIKYGEYIINSKTITNKITLVPSKYSLKELLENKINNLNICMKNNK